MDVASLVMGLKTNCISKMNRWNQLIFSHAGTNSGKLKIDFSDVWSKMVMAVSFMRP